MNTFCHERLSMSNEDRYLTEFNDQSPRWQSMHEIDSPDYDSRVSSPPSFHRGSVSLVPEPTWLRDLSPETYEVDAMDDLKPPPLCHQRSIECAFDAMEEVDEDDCSLVYRSLSVVGPSESACAMYEEPACFRTSGIFAHSDGWTSELSPVYRDQDVYRDCVTMDRHCLNVERRYSSKSTLCTLNFDLPSEILEMVMHLLPCHPDLFCAMRVSKLWRDAARASSTRRQRNVAPGLDSLLFAMASSEPGDTLVLEDGLHMLSKELTIDKPIRLTGTAESSAVLCSRSHVVVRTRCLSAMVGLTLCRLGDEIGFPNAVVFAEAGRLTMDGCRVTCGGAATTAHEALCAFDGAPQPGQPWTTLPPRSGRIDPTQSLQTRPQSGIWVGAAAIVCLTRCIISCTLGPGIKNYKGWVEAEESTIAFSCRGANVLSNGGTVRLSRNEICGANGDGISEWNDANIDATSNYIHSNSGSGVAINSGRGKICIINNKVFHNRKTAVMFSTSQAKQVPNVPC